MSKAKSSDTNSIQKDFCLSSLFLSPLLTSDRAGWNKVYLEFHSQLCGEIPKCYAQKHTLCINTASRQYRSERWLGENIDRQCIVTGDIFVISRECCNQ